MFFSNLFWKNEKWTFINVHFPKKSFRFGKNDSLHFTNANIPVRIGPFSLLCSELYVYETGLLLYIVSYYHKLLRNVTKGILICHFKYLLMVSV